MMPFFYSLDLPIHDGIRKTWEIYLLRVVGDNIICRIDIKVGGSISNFISI